MNKENVDAVFFELGRTRGWFDPANRGVLKSIVNIERDEDLPNWTVNKPNSGALRDFKLSHKIKIHAGASPAFQALVSNAVEVPADACLQRAYTVEDIPVTQGVTEHAGVGFEVKLDEAHSGVDHDEKGDTQTYEEELEGGELNGASGAEEEAEIEPVYRNKRPRKKYNTSSFIDDEAGESNTHPSKYDDDEGDDGQEDGDEDGEEDSDEESGEEDEEEDSYASGSEDEGDEEYEEGGEDEEEENEDNSECCENGDELEEEQVYHVQKKKTNKMVVFDSDDEAGNMPSTNMCSDFARLSIGNHPRLTSDAADTEDAVYEDADSDDGDGDDEEEEEDEVTARMNIIAQLARAQNPALTTRSRLSIEQVCRAVSLHPSEEAKLVPKPAIVTSKSPHNLLVQYSDSEDDEHQSTTGESEVEPQTVAQGGTSSDCEETPAAQQKTLCRTPEVVVLSSEEEGPAFSTKKSRNTKTIVLSEDDDTDLDAERNATPKPIRRNNTIPATTLNRPTTTPFRTPKSPVTPLTKPKPVNARISPKSAKAFVKTAHAQADRLFKEFNDTVFEGKLPNIPVVWAKKLNTTAGRAILKKRDGEFVCEKIELATKVVDSQGKLESTLMHEMCHAAAWVIDHVSDPPHGDVFYYWARLAERKYSNSISVSTCHNYEIRYNFNYECTKESCKFTVGRHSKSIDTQTQVCPRCRSTLRLLPRLKKDGTPCTPSRFATFLKEHLSKAKKENPNLPHKDVMALLTAKYREMGI